MKISHSQINRLAHSNVLLEYQRVLSACLVEIGVTGKYDFLFLSQQRSPDGTGDYLLDATHQFLFRQRLKSRFESGKFPKLHRSARHYEATPGIETLALFLSRGLRLDLPIDVIPYRLIGEGETVSRKAERPQCRRHARLVGCVQCGHVEKASAGGVAFRSRRQRVSGQFRVRG